MVGGSVDAHHLWLRYRHTDFEQNKIYIKTRFLRCWKKEKLSPSGPEKTVHFSMLTARYYTIYDSRITPRRLRSITKKKKKKK